MSTADRYVRRLVSSQTRGPDGALRTTRDLAVWTLAHRGPGGAGRLDIWVYPTRDAALFAGADLAMQSGLADDPAAEELFAAGQYADVLQRYEHSHPDSHLLRVQAAFLQPDDGFGRGDTGYPAMVPSPSPPPASPESGPPLGPETA